MHGESRDRGCCPACGLIFSGGPSCPRPCGDGVLDAALDGVGLAALVLHSREPMDAKQGPVQANTR